MPSDDPEPTTVWMFRKGTGPEGVEGTLSLATSALVFEGEGDVVVRIPYKDVRKTKALRRAAVLEVQFLSKAMSERVGFFFSPPPPQPEASGDGPVPVLAGKRKRRVGALLAFRQGKEESSDTLREWLDALNARLGR